MIYIYGTGGYARIIFLLCKEIGLKNFKGFIVSKMDDNMPCQLYGYNVKEYIKEKNIILGLSKENTEDVKKILDKKCNILSLWN